MVLFVLMVISFRSALVRLSLLSGWLAGCGVVGMPKRFC